MRNTHTMSRSLLRGVVESLPIDFQIVLDASTRTQWGVYAMKLN